MELTHYGVLGMKWGRRRGRTTSVSNPSSDHTKAKQLKTKKMSEMSNDELRTLTQRLQLEKQYKDLNVTPKAKGKKIVTEILTNSAKQAASKYVNQVVNQQLDSIISKKKG